MFETPAAARPAAQPRAQQQKKRESGRTRGAGGAHVMPRLCAAMTELIAAGSLADRP